ncbi:hypothetical protein BKA64DRAFT_92610 [Cadophora sp. MPI-SDFR-AT-0126]|nr:hypothetical protein BKA64DRAFT_92610 [Leotiomycetes sp. MPI-SDFR-AT-0126]
MLSSGRVEKGMRKGTKSCAECRKRKVKCIFGTDTEKCLTCIARGTKCMTQTKNTGQVPAPSTTATSSKNVSLEERVAQLEARLISQASRHGSQSTPHDSTGSHGTPKSSEDVEVHQRGTNVPPYMPEHESPIHRTYIDSQEDDPVTLQPVGSLFNNAIWKQKLKQGGRVKAFVDEGKDSRINTCKRSSSKDAQICDELCRDLPSPRLMAAIIGATCSWWDTWRAVGSWLQDTLSLNNLHSLQETISWSLASSEPAVAALGLLCFAICLQQLDVQTHESIINQLPNPPGKLFHEYFDRVHRLVINNNAYSSTEPGVELILLAAKTCMNLGLLKNVWILHHQAVTYAQLLGFHRPPRIVPDETDLHMVGRHEAWFSICERDLYTSLQLGLPYAANWQTILPSLHSEPGTLRYFQYQMIRLSARISDRNSMGLESSFSEARNIECDMDSSAAEMPLDFWDAPLALQTGKISEQAYMSHLAVQFWYFHAKVLLHQPLMIQSIEDNQLLYHRDACLAACRDALRIYHLMRSDSMSAFSMVKLIDYQAFVCSAILLLGVLGYGSSNSPPSSLLLGAGSDYEIVELTMAILRKASSVSNNTMASQAVQGLDALAMLVRYSTNREKGAVCTASSENSIPYMRITVPGSGVITISPGKLIASAGCSSSESAGALATPTFNLSHQTGQPSVPQRASTAGFHQDLTYNGTPEMDVSIMDMDWTNMFSADLDDDWAWLADINAAGMV